MKRFLALAFLLSTALWGCASNPPRATDVSAKQMSNPSLANSFDGQEVRFSAKFVSMSTRSADKLDEDKKYALTSWTSVDGSSKLPTIMILGEDPVLLALTAGDVATIEGKARVKDGVVIIASHVTKI